MGCKPEPKKLHAERQISLLLFVISVLGPAFSSDFAVFRTHSSKVGVGEPEMICQKGTFIF